MLNFNFSPYNDDYDGSKGFHKVLFRPGYPVQARELTQLQTILQQQVSRFGNHLFQHGSMVIPGSFKFDNKVSYLKLADTYNGSTINTSIFTNRSGSYENRIVEGEQSGVRGIVVVAENESTVDGTPPTLMFKLYSNGGVNGDVVEFLPGENLKLVDTINTTTNISTGSVVATVYPSGVIQGTGSIATVDDGVYFIHGFFVAVNKQSLILEKYSDAPTYQVGLKFSEEIITEQEDVSLLDPALGSSNYNGPGAHRYKIGLSLIKQSPTDSIENNFVLLFNVVNGLIQEIRDKTQYSELMKMIAKRTYEESGNYIVDPFKNSIYEHNTDPTKALMVISGGIGFVGGYEVDNSKGFQVVELDKAKETKSLVNSLRTVTHGQFIVTANNYGIPEPLSTIELKDDTITANGTSRGTVIGYAKVLGTQYIVGNPLKSARTITVAAATNSTASVRNGGDTITSADVYQVVFDKNGNYNIITAISGNNITLMWPITSSLNDELVIGSNETLVKILLSDIDMDTGKRLDDVASYKVMTTEQFTGKSITGDVLTAYVLQGSNLITSGSSIATANLASGYGQVVYHDTNNNLLFVKRAAKAGVNGGAYPNTIWPAANSQLYYYANNPTTGTGQWYAVQTKEAFKVFNPQGGAALLPIGQFAIADLTNTKYSVFRAINGTFSASGPTYTSTVTIASNEVFPTNLDISNFMVWNTTTGKLLNGVVTISRTQTNSVTISTTDATVASDPIRVVASIEKSLIEKTKTLVETSISVTTPGSVISLGQADIYRLDWVFETANDITVTGDFNLNSAQVINVSSTSIDSIKIGTYVEGKNIVKGTRVKDIDSVNKTITLDRPSIATFSGSFLVRTDISNLFSLDNGQRDGMYDTGLIKIKSGVTIPASTIEVYYAYFEHSTGDFFSVKSYETISTAYGADYYPYIPVYRGSDGQVYRLQDCLDFRPAVTDGCINVVGSIGWTTTGGNGAVSGTTITVASGAGVQPGDTIWNNTNPASPTSIGTVAAGGVSGNTITMTAAASVANSTPLLFRSKVVRLSTGYSADELFVGQTINFKGLEDTIAAIANDNTTFTLGTAVTTQMTNININVGQVNTTRFWSGFYLNSTTPVVDPVVPGTDISFDHSYFLPRTDYVVITSGGNFEVRKGFSADLPEPPKVRDSDNQMVIYQLEMPPYTFSASDIRVTIFDKPGYTMEEIDQAVKRIDRLEEYTLLSLLEKNTKDLQIVDAATGLDRFKSGFVVDNFKSLSVIDQDQFSTVRLSPDEGTMAPPNMKEAHQLFFNTGESSNYSDVYTANGVVTIPFTESPYIVQPLATASININPFAMFYWRGMLTLDPDFNVDIATYTSTDLIISR